MKLKSLFEAKLKYIRWPMGLSAYEGKKYTLGGGSRSGSSPAGTTRLRYIIYDHATYEEDPKKSEVGIVDLFVEDGSGDILGLVNIEIKPKWRGGWGRSVVKDIVDTAGGSLRIHDVQRKAVGFWEKMGIQWDSAARQNGWIGKKPLKEDTLTESLSSPLPYKRVKGVDLYGTRSNQYQFSHHGVSLAVVIGASKGKKAANVSFYDEEFEDNFMLSHEVNDKFKNQGKSALKVFSTVIDIIKNDPIVQDLKAIEFTSSVSDESRIRLYDGMIRRLGKVARRYNDNRGGVDSVVWEVTL